MDRQHEYVLRTVEERGIRFIRLWFTDVLGFLKSFAITPAEDGTLWFLASHAGEDPVLADFEENGVRWLAIRRGEREVEVNMLVRRGGQLSAQVVGGGPTRFVGLPFESGRPDQLIQTRMITTDWTSGVHDALREVVAR